VIKEDLNWEGAGKQEFPEWRKVLETVGFQKTALDNIEESGL